MDIAENELIIQQIQSAVNVVMHSEHASSKVAACLFDNNGVSFASPSYRPAPLKACYEWDARIGRSSQFIHAELACVIGFTGTLAGAHMGITDPFCPNCAKLMAEAGIRNVYIDHKGFEKDFISRNVAEFEDMSMTIAAKAGMNVYKVNRKAGEVTPILRQAIDTQPTVGAYEFFDVPDDLSMDAAMDGMRTRLGTREAWVMAFVHDHAGKRHGLLVFEALPPGFTPHDFLALAGRDKGKYRYPTDPLIRLLILARRLGLRIDGGVVGSAEIPSSRALVNAVGFGLKGLVLASHKVDQDETARAGLDSLQAHKIIDTSFI